jgi:microcystin-dependent protein
MSEPFIGQIMQVGFNFAPTGWFTCQGQLLPISQYQALFALLGTYYGGNGVNNFALPDFQGRMPIGTGQMRGGSNYVIGQVGGAEQVTLLVSNMPSHTHIAAFQAAGATVSLNASTNAATLAAPTAGAFLAQSADTSGQANPVIYVPAASAGTTVALGGGSVSFGSGAVTNSQTGGSQPTPTMSPYLAVTSIIAYNGIFPSRS